MSIADSDAQTVAIEIRDDGIGLMSVKAAEGRAMRDMKALDDALGA